MQIIKDGAIVEDHWTHIADDPIPEDGCVTVSLGRWKAERDALVTRDGELGIRITSEDDLEAIAEDLGQFQLIALEFPVFTDGRCFSYARLLRDRYGFSGELRAIGNYIRDQIYFLSRVGINAFEFAEPEDLHGALSALQDFSVTYQACADEREPLYRRHDLNR